MPAPTAPGHSRKIFRGIVLSLAVIALPAAVPSLAQETAPPPTVTLKGRVVDASNGQTVPHARIEITDLRRREWANAQGEFELDLPAGSHIVRFHELGYDTLSEVWSASVDDNQLVVELTPKPLMLQAIRATGQRLEARIERLPVQVRAFEGDMVRRSGHPQALDFLTQYAGITPVPCSDRESLLANCAWVRGGIQQVVVYIDDIQGLAGLDQLRSFPMANVHRVEVLAGGAQIRVYTRDFIDRLARTGAPLASIRRPAAAFETLPDRARRGGRRGN